MYVIGAGTAAVFTPLGFKAARSKGVALPKDSRLLMWVTTLLVTMTALTFLPEALACVR